jgi:hypothetical protein
MTLQDAIKVVDELSRDELWQLRAYIDQRTGQLQPARGLTPEERIRQLDMVAAAIREGMTQAELDTMTAAMNEEHIEPVDDNLWTC